MAARKCDMSYWSWRRVPAGPAQIGRRSRPGYRWEDDVGALLYAEAGEQVMGEVVTIAENRLPRTHSGEAVAPLGPSGTPLRWELRQDGRRVYADTADDLLTVIIRGYPAAGAELAHEQLQARIKHAAAVKPQLTAHLLADATSAGDGVLGDADVLRTLSASAWHPVTLEADWTHPVALVLLDVAYQPFTDRPAPCGNIVWLRPSGAEPYLRSLAATGLYAVAEAL